MKSVRFLLVVAFLLGISSLTNVASAQLRQAQPDPVPLKSWSAPLYWLPNASETISAKLNAGFDSSASNVTRATQAPAGALEFVAVTPCRMVDTRTGAGFTGNFGPPSLGGGTKRTIPVQASPNCSIPSTAQAYSFKITIVPLDLSISSPWGRRRLLPRRHSPR